MNGGKEARGKRGKTRTVEIGSYEQNHTEKKWSEKRGNRLLQVGNNNEPESFGWFSLSQFPPLPPQFDSP